MAGGSADRHADGTRQTPALIAAAAVLLAAANVTFGLLYRTDAERAADFHQVLAWAGDWLRGSRVYGVEGSITDYPPNALVSIAPLAVLPAAYATVFWASLHLMVTAATGAMTHRLVRHGRFAIPLAALVIALPSFRIPMQLSVVSFALALAAFLMADKRPRLAGIALGLSLMKPHIAGPVLVWAFAARRRLTASIAIGVSAMLTAIYIARAGRRPQDVVADWVHALLRTQNRDDLVAGQTNLQPLVAWLGWPEVSLQLLTAAVLSVALCVIWIRRQDDAAFDLRFMAVACLMSLLSFRHLSYNLLLAIPALAFCASAGRAGRWLGGAALAVFIASPPSVWLHAVAPRFGGTPLDWLAEHAYRIAAAALFAYLLFANAPVRTPSGRPPSFA